jgi:predicted permease
MSLLADLSERFRALFRREQVDREFDDELAFHIEQDVAERMGRGIDPGEARRQAIVALGGIAQVTEQVRDARGVRALEDLAGDVRHALRLFRASPVFALTVIAVLGGALGAVIALFAVADTTTFSDARYGITARLVRIYESNSPTNRWSLSSVDTLALLEQQRSFDAVGVARRADIALAGAGVTERVVAGFATAGVFAATDLRAESGRLLRTADEEASAPPVAVVSHAFAAERFGATPTIGRDLVIDGVHHTIVGVLPPEVTEVAGMRSRIWLPLKIQTPRRRGPFWLRGIARLRQGVTIEMAAQDLAGISRRIFPLWAAGFRDQSAVLLPLPLGDTIDGDAAKRVTLFAGAVLLVWLIALANVATLMLVRASARAHELAIRLALGATRGRIARLLLIDCIVLTTAAGAAGVFIASLLVPMAGMLWPTLPHINDAAVNLRAVAFATGASVLSGVLVALPALITSLSRHRQPVRVDARRVGRDRRTSRLRSVLVCVEFALALPLVACACWFLQSMWRLQSIDPGYQAAGGVTLNIQLAGPRYADSEARATFWQRVSDRAREVPGITASGLGISVPPDDPGDVNNFDLIDVPAGGAAEPTAPWNNISPGFLDALGVRLLGGRNFTSAEYASGSTAVLVSESWARRYFPGTSALGRKMVSGGCTTCPLTEVVGVVSDVKYQGLEENSDAVYQAADGSNAYSLRMIARTKESEEDAIRQLTAAVRGIDSEVLVESTTLEARLGDALSEPRHWTALVAGFAAAAGILAALGVFGLMSYVVRQQRRDIGVRLALGAAPREMMLMVVRGGITYAIAGSLAGAGLALIAGQWLSTSSFGIHRANGWVVIGIAAVLTVVAALASWWPAYQASRIPMTEALSVD